MITMIRIAFCLFAAWILGLFGFDTLVINGANELFGVHMTETGYYFCWVLFSIILTISFAIRGGGTKVKIEKSGK
ncbi:hypothetical protein [Paenibacillus sp. MMO-177]|uniref:hypothetical protein n=1 Tax=Paenibacillus sp. MMO-177 TaxID=3081289 RepID=UPI003016D2DE